MSPDLKKEMEKLFAESPEDSFVPSRMAVRPYLLKALEELGYAVYRESGMSHDQARSMTKIIAPGSLCMTMLVIALKGVKT
jgi:hypothetical protein